jgi:hypothetical protein
MFPSASFWASRLPEHNVILNFGKLNAVLAGGSDLASRAARPLFVMADKGWGLALIHFPQPFEEKSFEYIILK